MCCASVSGDQDPRLPPEAMTTIKPTRLTALMLAGALFTVVTAPLRAQAPRPDEADKALMFALEEIIKLSPEEKASKLSKLAQEYGALVNDGPLEIATVPGKLSPPKVLIGGDEGWNPASDNEGALDRLFRGNSDQRKAGERAIMLEGVFIHLAPEKALKSMVPRLGSAKPTLKDAMNLHAACYYRQPGTPLSKQVPKELWLQFYNSPNPCYKILALEKYDSTTQSPEELLKLYRECLFHTFGYLQVRALEGIYRSKDFRPEVRALIEEFQKSSPVENDGTLPTYPGIIHNPIKGAEYVLDAIKKSSGGTPAAK
jgi:hypothetical protein